MYILYTFSNKIATELSRIFHSPLRNAMISLIFPGQTESICSVFKRSCCVQFWVETLRRGTTYHCLSRDSFLHSPRTGWVLYLGSICHRHELCLAPLTDITIIKGQRKKTPMLIAEDGTKNCNYWEGNAHDRWSGPLAVGCSRPWQPLKPDGVQQGSVALRGRGVSSSPKALLGSPHQSVSLHGQCLLAQL